MVSYHITCPPQSSSQKVKRSSMSCNHRLPFCSLTLYLTRVDLIKMATESGRVLLLLTPWANMPTWQMQFPTTPPSTLSRLTALCPSWTQRPWRQATIQPPSPFSAAGSRVKIVGSFYLLFDRLMTDRTQEISWKKQRRIWDCGPLYP